LDLPDVGPGGDQAILHLLELGPARHREAEVVDGAPSADAAPFPDERLGRHLEHVEGPDAAHVEDEHPGVVALGLHAEGHLGLEDRAVPLGEAVEVGGERGHVVEAVGDGHGRLLRHRSTLSRRTSGGG
jgi:hypothetical protein